MANLFLIIVLMEIKIKVYKYSYIFLSDPINKLFVVFFLQVFNVQPTNLNAQMVGVYQNDGNVIKNLIVMMDPMKTLPCAVSKTKLFF